MKNNYKFLLSTPLKTKWKKIGLKRRAGVVAPLFFVWSKKSLGIGEIPDIKLLIDFCKKANLSILQLLPLNDTGFNSSPYSLQDGFALNPIYLSLENLIGVKKEILKTRIKTARKQILLKKERVEYHKIKILKLNMLWEFFSKNADLNLINFKDFKEKNSYWLEDYAVFRVLKEKFNESKWTDWPKKFRKYKKNFLIEFAKQNSKKIEFQKWLQWQLFEQLKEIKDYAEEKKILLVGDFCWLMSNDSADVWAKGKYFESSFEIGTPPVSKKEKGQRWGFPPLNWKKIIKDKFSYIKDRLKYLENLYHIIRIDHVLGIFRIWKMPLKKKDGWFEPKNEKEWRKRGEKILLKIIKNTKMLPIAEDLGLVFPGCLKALKKLGILGMKVQRWQKEWKRNFFIRPEDYSPFSIATISTHDTSNWVAWWKKEASKLEKEQLFKIFSGKKEKISFKKIIKKNLEAINSARSIFCILLLNEWLFIENFLRGNPSKYTFNQPGTVSPKNWSIRLRIPLENLLNSSVIPKIRKIIEKTKRTCQAI